jgi:transposase
MNELSAVFPDILKLGSLYDTTWVRRVVQRYPVPSFARKATRRELDKLIPRSVHKVDRDALLAQLKRASSFMSAANEAVIAREVVFELATAELFITHSEKLYRALGREIDALAAKPTAEGHASDAAIIASIPGVGAVTCATLITQASPAIAARNVEGLRAISGTAPVTRKSGKQGRPGGRKVEVSMRRACRHDLRRALHNMASSNIVHDPRSKTYYATLRTRGIGHADALRRVADQILRLMMALLKSHQLYDLSRRIAQRPPRPDTAINQQTSLTGP